jgi:hypothetical protein
MKRPPVRHVLYSALEQTHQVGDPIGLLPRAQGTDLEMIDPTIVRLFVDVTLNQAHRLVDGALRCSGEG